MVLRVYLGVELANVLDFRRGELGVLDEDQSRGQQGALTHVVDRIVHHRFQQRHRFLHGRQSCCDYLSFDGLLVPVHLWEPRREKQKCKLKTEPIRYWAVSYTVIRINVF